MQSYTLLNGVGATGAGSAVQPESNRRELPVSLYGITTATVAIEGSLDGTNFQAIVSKTADGAFSVPYFPYIRANVTAWTAGSIFAKIGY